MPMSPTLRVSFDDFVDAALRELRKNYPLAKEVDRSKLEFLILAHDGDRGICEMPEVVELPLIASNSTFTRFPDA